MTALAPAGIDRVNSQGSNISGLGGPMESVGEDQEMKGSDWASAMRILTDMEHDQQHDGHDRCAALRSALPRQLSGGAEGPEHRVSTTHDMSWVMAHPG